VVGAVTRQTRQERATAFFQLVIMFSSIYIKK
jgi:hypothetical protein